MARPLKINDEIIKTVVDAIRAGNYIETAAAYAGINKDTVYEWLKRGAREKQRLKKKEQGSGNLRCSSLSFPTQ